MAFQFWIHLDSRKRTKWVGRDVLGVYKYGGAWQVGVPLNGAARTSLVLPLLLLLLQQQLRFSAQLLRLLAAHAPLLVGRCI